MTSLRNALTVGLAFCATLSLGAVPGFAQEAPWSMSVKTRAPAFDSEGTWSEKAYMPLPTSEITKKWDICVLFPHTKDPYYIAMTYGAVTEAERTGTSMSIFAAGGYTELPTQISQLEDCVTRGADAIAMVAISATGLNRAIATAKDRGVPVAVTGGDVDSNDVAARAQGNWFDSGRIPAEYLLKRHPEASPTVKVLWLAGPEGPNWSVDSADGFVKTIGDSSSIEIQKVIWGEPGKAAQIPLIEDALQAYPDVNYIAGIAPAIEGAVQVLKEKGRDDIKLISSYMTPQTLKALENSEIQAVVTDFTAGQASIAIDQLVRILEGKEVDRDVDTGFAIVDAESLGEFKRSLSLAPEGWQPYFSVE